MKLHAINGGKASSSSLTPAALKRRYKQLRSIDRRTLHARHSHSGPRGAHAVSVAFWVTAGLVGLAMLLDRVGAWAALDVPVSVRAGIKFVPCLIGFATWIFLLRRGTYPTSWGALIDQELAAYDPVDADAYRNLQQRTRDAGYLDLDEVRPWRCVEWNALDIASGRLTPPQRSFISKKV